VQTVCDVKIARSCGTLPAPATIIFLLTAYFGQGCQMVPNLANIAKNHCFPKYLPIFLAIFFNAKNLLCLKDQL